MSSDQLAQLYQQFMTGIYEPSEDSADFVQPGAMSAADQLAIYRGSVMGGLVQALGDLFPAVKKSLGETFFDAMATRYVKAHPSQSYSLDHYGASFPAFIEQFPPLKDYPFMPGLARLEYAWHLTFHAADEPEFDPSSLASIPSDAQVNIRFELSSSLTVIESDFPLLALWEMNQENAEDVSVDLESGGQNVAIWRDGLVTRLRVMDEVEWHLFLALKNFEALGTIFASLLSNFPHEDVNLALARFMQDGWIAGYQLDQ